MTPPADLNGLVRLAERRNRVSARVPSHFNWPLPPDLNLNGTCAYFVVCGFPFVVFGCVSRTTLRREVSNVVGGCFDYCGKYVD